MAGPDTHFGGPLYGPVTTLGAVPFGRLDVAVMRGTVMKEAMGALGCLACHTHTQL